MEQSTLDVRFNRIYDRTYRKTAAYLTARCRNLSDVEDLLQETYLAVYRALQTRGPDALQNEEAYVISTAKSKLADWYRAAGRAVPTLDADDAWLASVPDAGPTPEESAVCREASAAALALVAEKDEPTRRAFFLRCCFGASYGEIAGLLGRNESTVRTGVFRLSRELWAELERSTT